MVVGGWWLGGRRGGRWLWLEFEEGEEGEEGRERGDGYEVPRREEREREREKEGHWLLFEKEREI